MKNKVLLILITGFLSIHAFSQEVVRLYNDKAPGSENWTWNEKEMYSDIFETKVVYNVSDPTITVYKPDKLTANGTSVIICPGGGFHTLSIDREGVDVAKWLNSIGVTAFILKYRLVKSETDNPVSELLPLLANRKKLDSINAPVVQMSIQDGLTAVKYVRDHSREFGIAKNQIGLMGFSAGGTVALGATLMSTPENRPDFVAPIYASTIALKIPDDLKGEPPVFIVGVTDDRLGLAPYSSKLYNSWIASGNSAELHMYSKGGHGFGMKKQGLPVDKWIDRFEDWLTLLGFMTKK